MKIAYFGLPLGALLLLHDRHELGLAVLSPLPAPGLRRLRGRLGAERVLWGEDENSQQISNALLRLQPDVIVSWYFTRLIPAQWLGLAKQGGIGAHPSLLPRHRGPNPFFWSIDAGDSHSGVSIHRLQAEYDTGAIIAQHSEPIGDRNAWQLARLLDRPSLRLLREVVQRISRHERLDEVTQNATSASWAAEPEGKLLAVDWTWSSKRVLRRIRALAPVPGLAIEVHGLRFFITEAGEAGLSLPALDSGEAALLGKKGDLRLGIRTADGLILVEQAALGVNDPNLGLAEGQLCNASQLAATLLRVAPHMIDSVTPYEAS